MNTIEIINNYLESKDLYFVNCDNKRNHVFQKVLGFDYTYIPYSDPDKLYIEILNKEYEDKSTSLSENKSLLFSTDAIILYDKIAKQTNQKIFRNINLKIYSSDNKVNLLSELPIQNNNCFVEFYNYFYFGKLEMKIFKKRKLSLGFTQLIPISIELALVKQNTNIFSDPKSLKPFLTKSCSENILEKYKNIKIISDKFQIESIFKMIQSLNYSSISNNCDTDLFYFPGFLNGVKVYAQVPDWLLDMYVK